LRSLLETRKKRRRLEAAVSSTIFADRCGWRNLGLRYFQVA
jgi:hypothetical protein